MDFKQLFKIFLVSTQGYQTSHLLGLFNQCGVHGLFLEFPSRNNFHILFFVEQGKKTFEMITTKSFTTFPMSLKTKLDFCNLMTQMKFAGKKVWGVVWVL